MYPEYVNSIPARLTFKGVKTRTNKQMEQQNGFRSVLGIIISCGLLMPVCEASLVGYYAFEGNFNDTSGSAVVNNAAPSQNPSQVSFAAGGFRGQAVDINDPAANGGSNSGGSVDIPINTNPAALPGVTFGGWFNLDSNAGFPGVMGTDQGGWDRGIHLRNNQWGIASGGALTNVAAAPTGQWQYVVGTFDKPGNTATLYVGSDNALVSTLTSGSRADAANGISEPVIEIGRYDAQDLDALVDDAFVFDMALDAYEVNAIRNLRLASSLDYSPVEAAGLFELYDAGTGSRVYNNSTWVNASGLTGTPGQVLDFGNGSFTLVLDAAGNGVMTVPEPAVGFALIPILFLAVILMRRRRALPQAA